VENEGPKRIRAKKDYQAIRAAASVGDFIQRSGRRFSKESDRGFQSLNKTSAHPRIVKIVLTTCRIKEFAVK